MSDEHTSGYEDNELPEDLKAFDAAVGKALRESVDRTANPELVDRVVAASLQDLPARTLPISRATVSRRWTSPQFRAAAALLFVTGLVLVAWFAMNSQNIEPVKSSPSVVVDFQNELGIASAEEVILVAILDGDGVWIEQELLDQPGATAAEPILRTRGTNVDDLADEINEILGATS